MNLADGIRACLVLSALLDTSKSVSIAAESLVEQGRRIYEAGILPDGSTLRATRMGQMTVEGPLAACVSCHRRSGMGTVEGNLQIQPVNATFLFAGAGDRTMASMDLRGAKRMNQVHVPYDDSSLARAVRAGVNANGQTMSELMPRYEMDSAVMVALTAYLRQLSVHWSPGVTDEVLRLATVVTPDVSPRRRRAFLETINTILLRKSGSTAPGKRHMFSAAELVLNTSRHWVLDVWTLEGPPESWREQLEAFYRQNPVFALVSGLAGDTFDPVTQFCEDQQMPCWFPSVSSPVEKPGFYSVYFSRGVGLEADLLATYLRSHPSPVQSGRRIIQIYRESQTGRRAAGRLSGALDGAGLTIENHAMVEMSVDGLHRALKGVKQDDVVMLWLEAEALALLERVAVPTATVYFSAELAGGERAPLPSSWRRVARLLYPYALPDRRIANLAYFTRWVQENHLQVLDEPLQAEVFFALEFFTETVADMLDNLYRDYLMERAESMLSEGEGRKAESRTLARRTAGGRESDTLAQTGTSPYPQLGLGPDQRFASKSGYVVRFDRDGRLVPVTELMVP